MIRAASCRVGIVRRVGARCWRRPRRAAGKRRLGCRPPRRYTPTTSVAALAPSHHVPAFVTLLAAWWLGERLTRAKAVALVLCVAGSALMVGGGHGEPLGIALALAAAVIYSLYIVGGTKATRGVDPLATTAVICLSATATLVAIALVRTTLFGTPPRWPVTAGGWAAMLAIALVSTVAAMLAFFAGLERLGAARTSMLSTLEPVVTVALAALLFGEALSPLQWAGGVAILAAVLALVRAGGAAADDATATSNA